MPKAPNYTEKDVVELKDMYAKLGNDGLEEIASHFDKTVRSVRAKLVREQVYVAPDKPTSVKKNEGPTKKELIVQLSKITGSKHEGIDGATKGAISELIGLFETDEVVD